MTTISATSISGVVRDVRTGSSAPVSIPGETAGVCFWDLPGICQYADPVGGSSSGDGDELECSSAEARLARIIWTSGWPCGRTR
jgi:hypothetical protein